MRLGLYNRKDDIMLKDAVKQMFYNYAVKNPYMYREGWEPVADYGVNRYTLGNVGLGALGNLVKNNPMLLQEINKRMMMNESMYNPNFYNQMGL